MAALDVDAAGPGDPGTRPGHGDGAGRRPAHGLGRRPARSGEDHRASLEQIPWAERKAAGVAVPVLQVDATVFDSHHRSDIARFDVLDDEAELGRVLSRAGLAPTGGEGLSSIGSIGSIAINHPAILGSSAAKRGCGAPPPQNW